MTLSIKRLRATLAFRDVVMAPDPWGGDARPVIALVPGWTHGVLMYAATMHGGYCPCCPMLSASFTVDGEALVSVANGHYAHCARARVDL